MGYLVGLLVEFKERLLFNIMTKCDTAIDNLKNEIIKKGNKGYEKTGRKIEVLNNPYIHIIKKKYFY